MLLAAIPLVALCLSQASGFGYGGMGYGGHGKYGLGYGMGYGGLGYGMLGYGMLGFGLWGWPGAYQQNFGRMLANAQMFKRNMHYDPFSMPVMNPYQTIGDYAGFADQLKAATGDAERPYKNVEFGAGSESSPKSRKRRSHRVKSGYHIRRLPSVRPWNMMGNNYPGFAYNPYYSYSKSAYYNHLNKMLRRSYYNKRGPSKYDPAKKTERKKRSLGFGSGYGLGSGYYMRRLPSKRPWNMFGYNYPGFAYNPYYSYSKAAYYNYLNRMMAKSFYNKHGPRKYQPTEDEDP